jgi:hypothetical protein
MGHAMNGELVKLPALVERAIATLANARSAAELLEARDMASVVYDMAKKAARLAEAKGAHDGLVSAAHRAQADALEIESQAKRRLADEYDAAQERHEVAKAGDNQHNREVVVNADDLGLDRDQIYQARQIRDAEKIDPGIVRRTLDEALASGQEPTKAKVRAKVRQAIKTTKKRKKRSRGRYAVSDDSVEARHDADLRRLEVAWVAACSSAREASGDESSRHYQGAQGREAGQARARAGAENPGAAGQEIRGDHGRSALAV